MDHARIHPRFLHSNATSHKWVLGGTRVISIDKKFDSCFSLIVHMHFFYSYHICFYVVSAFTAFAELMDNSLDEVNAIPHIIRILL